MSCSGRKPVFWLSLLPSTPAPSLLCPADQGCRHTKQSDNEDHAVQVLGAIKKKSMIAMMMVEMIMIMFRWASGSCAGDWPNNRHWFPIQYTGLEHTEVIIITTAIIIVITIISIIILIITISLRIITAKIQLQPTKGSAHNAFCLASDLFYPQFQICALQHITKE